MAHVIELTVVDDPVNGVAVTSNPYPAMGKGITVKPGDTVKWSYNPAMELQVIFSKTGVLPELKIIEDVSPYGPFSSINVLVGEGLTVGTVRSDVPTTTPGKRFFCKIFRDGKELPWNGDGGLDIPMTPG